RLTGFAVRPMMSEVSGDSWFAGVDGCRGGWVVAFARRQSGELRVRVVPRFADVLAAPEAPAVIAVDIPIGLPETGGREADRIARSFVGMRRSSVFPVPSRRAVYAELGPFSNQQTRYAAHRRGRRNSRRDFGPPQNRTYFCR